MSCICTYMAVTRFSLQCDKRRKKVKEGEAAIGEGGEIGRVEKGGGRVVAEQERW